MPYREKLTEHERELLDQLSARQRNIEKESNNSVTGLTIPVGIAWTGLGSIVGAVLWCALQFWDLKQAVKDGTGDRWKKSFQREWAHQMQTLNPQLHVPDPDQISKSLDER